MSRMMLRSDGKPPLPRSPIRLRPRRKPLQPTNSNIIQSPPVKPQLPNPERAVVETPDLRPEYQAISGELQALSKLVHQGLSEDTPMAECCVAPLNPPLFERGRFYEEYSARRNERLKRKKGEMEKKHSYDLGVRLDSNKMRESAKKPDERRKKVGSVAESSPARSLGCAKENRKPPPSPAPVPIMSGWITERKAGVRRNRKAC